MNPRTRRLRRLRRNARKRDDAVFELLRRGYPRHKRIVELATTMPSYTIRIKATFDG